MSPENAYEMMAESAKLFGWQISDCDIFSDMWAQRNIKEPIHGLLLIPNGKNSLHHFPAGPPGGVSNIQHLLRRGSLPTAAPASPAAAPPTPAGAPKVEPELPEPGPEPAAAEAAPNVEPEPAAAHAAPQSQHLSGPPSPFKRPLSPSPQPGPNKKRMEVAADALNSSAERWKRMNRTHHEFYCSTCDLDLNGAEAYATHMAGKFHKNRLPIANRGSPLARSPPPVSPPESPSTVARSPGSRSPTPDQLLFSPCPPTRKLEPAPQTPPVEKHTQQALDEMHCMFHGCINRFIYHVQFVGLIGLFLEVLLNWRLNIRAHITGMQWISEMKSDVGGVVAVSESAPAIKSCLCVCAHGTKMDVGTST